LPAGSHCQETDWRPARQAWGRPSQITQRLFRSQSTESCCSAAASDTRSIAPSATTTPAPAGAPSFVTDDSRGFRLRGEQVALPDAPVGYYFEVVTDGFGAMPSYAVQVPPRDRWAIIAYIRALQLAGHARLADLPESEREAARKAIDREDRNEP
jgi:hypothetical protein